MEDLLSVFDTIVLDRTSVICDEDRKVMKALQKNYSAKLAELHVQYLWAMQRVKEHPTKNIKIDTYGFHMDTEPYEVKDRYDDIFGEFVFIPENTAAVIASMAVNLTCRFEREILKHFTDKYRIRLEPKPLLYKTLLPDTWQNYSVPQRESRSWYYSTDDYIQLKTEGKHVPTLPDTLVIPTWEEAVDGLLELMDGLTFPQMQVKQRKDKVRKLHIQSRLSRNILTFKSDERNIFREEYHSKPVSKDIFFNLVENDVFDLLMFYENKTSVAYPSCADPQTGFIKTEDYSDIIHNNELKLEGSDICQAMTMMRNNTVKLHFKSPEAAQQFQEWCITRPDGSRDNSKTY